MKGGKEIIKLKIVLAAHYNHLIKDLSEPAEAPI